MPADILLAGHIVKDVVSGGWQPGGGVTYGAVQAQRLGLSVAALTSCATDVAPATIVPGVDWHVVPSDSSTSFDNRYVSGRREQRVLSHATHLSLLDLPLHWRSAPLALITPVFHEASLEFAARLQANGSFVGLGAQGWLRRLVDGRVAVDKVEPQPAWLNGDAVFVSEEDVLDPESVALWRDHVAPVVLTRARQGCTIWDTDSRHDLPAFETQEVDPTGAGDVFAVAFLVRFKETGNSVEAARFGCAAAALAVRALGLDGIGGRKEIEALIRRQEAVRS